MQWDVLLAICWAWTQTSLAHEKGRPGKGGQGGGREVTNTKQTQKLYKKLIAVIMRNNCPSYQVIAVLEQILSEYQTMVDSEKPLVNWWRHYYRQFDHRKENRQ